MIQILVLGVLNKFLWCIFGDAGIAGIEGLSLQKESWGDTIDHVDSFGSGAAQMKNPQPWW